MTVVSIVGASGRLGRMLVDGLGAGDPQPIARRSGEDVTTLAARSVAGAGLVVNAAGVAHIDASGPDDARRLLQGNVELPLALAGACLSAGIPFVHVSSVKAVDPDDSPYARSKRDGDDRLASDFGSQFADHNLPLVIVRPIALLIPPFDAGKLSSLRWIGLLPRWLVPRVPMPVMTASTMLRIVDRIVADALAGRCPPGIEVVAVAPSDRATLQEVHDTMAADRRGS